MNTYKKFFSLKNLTCSDSNPACDRDDTTTGYVTSDKKYINRGKMKNLVLGSFYSSW